MWKLIKGIFGGKDTASKAMDLATTSITGIGDWIDKKDYTNQERAIDLSKAVDAHLELIKATVNENSMQTPHRSGLGACRQSTTATTTRCLLPERSHFSVADASAVREAPC